MLVFLSLLPIALTLASLLSLSQSQEPTSTAGYQPTQITCTDEATCGNLYSKDYLQDVYYSGLRRVTSRARTTHCKQTIEFEYMKHIRALTSESPFPFEDVLFYSHCPKTVHHTLTPVVKNYVHASRPTAQLPLSQQRLPAEFSQKNPDSVRILYTLLAHQHPQFVLRLIDAIDEPLLHSIVIHVDAKNDAMHALLQEKLAKRSNIHVMPDEWRQSLSWGGFSIVNATLSCIKYYHHLQQHTAATTGTATAAESYDFVVDISGTHYPLKSNRFIREVFSQDLNMIFMETYDVPSRPESHVWHQFVECDGALHRVARLPVLKGINMFLSSQWWALPRHVIEWMLSSSLAADYAQYAQYVIVADENFFSTLLHNSPFCEDPLRRTLLFQIFDKWEHEKNHTLPTNGTFSSVSNSYNSSSISDHSVINNSSSSSSSNSSSTGVAAAELVVKSRKCLGLGEESCGRSPSTLTMEYEYLLSSSRALFARKFDPLLRESVQLVDFIDEMRGTHSSSYSAATERWDRNKDDRGKLVMIRAAYQQPIAAVNTTATADVDGVTTTMNASLADVVQQQQCMMYMGPQHMYIMMQQCDPLNAFQWFEIGRCSSGYEVVIEDGQCPQIRRIADNSSSSISGSSGKNGEAFCSIITKQSGGGGASSSSSNASDAAAAAEVCVDISGENARAGAAVIGYECTGRWNQLFNLHDNCTISALQPEIVGRVRGFGDSNVRVCLDSSHEQRVVTSASCSHAVEVEVNVDIEVEVAAGEEDLTDELLGADGEVDAGGTGTAFADLLAQQQAILLREEAKQQQKRKQKVRNFTSAQQFEFLPAHGAAYAALMREQQRSPAH